MDVIVSSQKYFLHSMLFLVTSLSFAFLIELFHVFGDSFCLQNLIYNYTFNIHILYSIQQLILIDNIDATCLLIYVLYI